MGRVGGQFTFPAARYFEKSTEFKRKLDHFSDEINSKFFQVVSRHMTSLHSTDQQYIEGVLPYSRGKSRLKKLETLYIPKWNSMQTENSNNPMHQVLETDQKYKRTFMSLKDEQLKERLTQQYDFDVQQAVFGELQGMPKEEIISKFKGMTEVLGEVVGNDWYKRLKQASSYADFINNFSDKFDEIAKKNPTKAAILLRTMEQSDGFTKLLRESEAFVKKLKSSKHMQAALALAAKPNKLLKLTKDLGDKKLLKFLQRTLEFAADSKIVKKVIGAGVRFGWAGAVVSVGLHGYYNVRDERIWNDFQEGKAVRASVKTLAGTGVDMLENFGIIDGLVGGALIGGAIGGTVTIPAFGIGAVPAAVVGAIVGGVAGGINQGLQFLFPNMYDGLKTRTFQAIDWAADKAVQFGQSVKDTYNSVKSTASNVISAGKQKVRDVGNAIQNGINKTKQIVKTGERVKKLFDSINPFKKPSPNY